MDERVGKLLDERPCLTLQHRCTYVQAARCSTRAGPPWGWSQPGASRAGCLRREQTPALSRAPLAVVPRLRSNPRCGLADPVGEKETYTAKPKQPRPATGHSGFR